MHQSSQDVDHGTPSNELSMIPSNGCEGETKLAGTSDPQLVVRSRLFYSEPPALPAKIHPQLVDNDAVPRASTAALQAINDEEVKHAPYGLRGGKKRNLRVIKGLGLDLSRASRLNPMEDNDSLLESPGQAVTVDLLCATPNVEPVLDNQLTPARAEPPYQPEATVSGERMSSPRHIKTSPGHDLSQPYSFPLTSPHERVSVIPSTSSLPRSPRFATITLLRDGPLNTLFLSPDPEENTKHPKLPQTPSSHDKVNNTKKQKTN